MPAFNGMTDIIDLEDDRPIAARRKRRSSTGPNELRDSQVKNENTAAQIIGMATPPATPHRTKKRVRFSEPGSASTTGLTPFLCRNSISSPPPSRRRVSTPSTSTRWNLAIDDSPILSGTLQFAPIRQVLGPRVKRRLRRNHLSEEVNTIKFEEREEKRSQKTEIERLTVELREKTQEAQVLRNELDLASQIGKEAGMEAADTTHVHLRVQILESRLANLRAELERCQRDMPMNDDRNWISVADDVSNVGDTFMPTYDDDFNAEMTDVFISTPRRRSFPSPPASMPNTPSKPVSHTGSDNEASACDIERQHLESQLKTLQDELKSLSKSLELTNTTHDRLSAKLSPFIEDLAIYTDGNDSLDTALDSVLTQLALSQSAAVESTTRFRALTDEITTFFPSSSSQDPDSILKELQKQFRAARLELEYLTPGETPEGFDNTKLLDMLVSRLRTLAQKVAQQDSDIDQYHSQEISLRQQLGSRTDAMTQLQSSLTTADSKISKLGLDLSDRDESISKLTHALQGYRDEVSGLETLISRVEVDHAADLAILRDEIDLTQRDGEGRLLDAKSKVSDMEARFHDAEGRLLDAELRNQTLHAAAQGRELLMHELDRRLSAALASSQSVQDELTALQQNHATTLMRLRNDHAIAIEALQTDKESSTAEMQQAALAKEKQHGTALALRDARVTEFREEVERVNVSLEEAHARIVTLERVKRDLLRLIKDAVGGVVKMGRDSQNVAKDLEVAPTRDEGYEGGNSSPIAGPVTAIADRALAVAQEGIRVGGLFDASAAKRRNSGDGTAKLIGKKRRRYDSGLGFLDEGEEEEEAEVAA